MENRKLIQSGPSSLVISLPSWWIKENNLQKGMNIDITTLGQDLLLKPRNNQKIEDKKEKKQYFLKDEEPYVIKEVLSYCFINNVEEIIIPLSLVKTIKPLLNKIPGAELRMTKDKAVIYNFFDKKNINPNKEIKHCLKSAHDIFKRILHTKKEEDTYELISSLKNLIRRILIVESYVNELIMDAEKRSNSPYSFVEIVRIKQFVKELPNLLKHEIRLIKIMMYYSNKNSASLFLEIDKAFNTEVDVKKSEILEIIKNQIHLKNLIEKQTDYLIHVKDQKEIIVIDQIISILYCLRRLSAIRRPFM